MPGVAFEAILTRSEPVARDDGRAEPSSPLERLAERARDGDGTAFDRLMIETQARVLATAWRLLGSREDALDASQEVYVRVYRHLRGYRSNLDFHGWLHRITVNVYRDAARKRGPRVIPPESFREQAREADAEQSLLEAERRALLFEALQTLSAKERAALVLRDLEGLSSEQVARILGSRAGTVRARISKARAKIRDYCERLFTRSGGPDR
jgi:RNA polymerase sigma-70 factor (ECF subfamily)